MLSIIFSIENLDGLSLISTSSPKSHQRHTQGLSTRAIGIPESNLDEQYQVLTVLSVPLSKCGEVIEATKNCIRIIEMSSTLQIDSAFTSTVIQYILERIYIPKFKLIAKPYSVCLFLASLQRLVRF